VKKILFFIIPFAISLIGVFAYFKINQGISAIKIPVVPNISINDLVKYSRFSLNKAPSESLVGTITTLNGEVFYEPRIATESAQIFAPVNVQQGESLSTGTDGILSLAFENVLTIKLQNNSLINIIQTLPADLVFTQASGTADYEKLAAIPVSVRIKHLLVENNGSISVSIDPIKPITTITINAGSVTIAYNDINNIAKVLTFNEGYTIKFNDDTRKVVQE
jgi:hypothetical protein